MGKNGIKKDPHTNTEGTKQLLEMHWAQPEFVRESKEAQNSENQRSNQTGKLGYKASNNLLPIKLLSCLFTISNDVSLKKAHKYNRRHKEIPNVPVMNSMQYRNSFMYMCMKEYTDAANKIDLKKCIKRFVKHYKEILLKDY